MISQKRVAALAAVLAMLVVSACGGGGGESGVRPVEPPPGPVDPVDPPTDPIDIREDPTVIRLSEVADAADTLLIPTIYADYSITVLGQTATGDLVQSFNCAGDACVNAGDPAIRPTVENFVPVNADLFEVTDATLDSQGGFDTLEIAGTFDLAGELSANLTITDSPSGTGYGFWSQHGFAALEVGAGPMSGQFSLDGEAYDFTGSLSWASAYVFGAAAGTNPAGTGSATWNGIAEAASRADLQRHSGTATVTIADLSQPRVGVDIDIAGSPIGSTAWDDVPLVDGGFTTGSEGTDHLEGNFHGPDHSETYGTFDTDAYVGVFGARRE